MKKTLRFVLYGLLALVITACVAIFLIVKLALAPAAGEWSTTVKAGPLNFEIGVLVHTAPDVAAIKRWAVDLAQRCHPPKPEKRHKTRILGNVVEDLSRLLAPLL